MLVPTGQLKRRSPVGVPSVRRLAGGFWTWHVLRTFVLTTSEVIVVSSGSGSIYLGLLQCFFLTYLGGGFVSF